MNILCMSNPSCSVRLKKLRESQIPQINDTILNVIKSGNAFLYSFTDSLPHNEAKLIIEETIIRRGIRRNSKEDQEKRLKRINDSNRLPQESTLKASNNTIYSYENEELDEADKDKLDDDYLNEYIDIQCNNENEELENNYSENQNFKEDISDNSELSNEEVLAQSITMGEALEMIDEVSNRVIDMVVGTFWEMLKEKYTELNTKIIQLEEKISSQSSNSRQESKEEILARARNLVRQKILTRNDK